MATNVDVESDYILNALHKTDRRLASESHWGKGFFCSLGRHYCLVGAAKYANNTGLGDPCINFMCDRLRDYESYANIGSDTAWSLVVTFNDLPETTFEHVKAFLKYCIDYREWMLTTGATK